MRRDYFTLDVRNTGDDEGTEHPDIPTLAIDFTGPAEQLEDQFTDEFGDAPASDEIDVSYRLHGPIDDADVGGVLAVSDRVTGDFILELNVGAGTITGFVDSARAYGKDTGDGKRYRIEVTIGGEPFVAYEKATFLVYDSDGGLLRGHSLIPSGVEL